MDLQERLLKRLLALKESQSLRDIDVADMVGVSKAVWGNWKTRGRVSKDGVVLIEKNMPNLMTVGPELDDARMRGAKVNVISYVMAGEFDPAVDPYPPGDSGEEPLSCPVPHSEHAFALRVRGSSMTAPYGRSYPEGCYIFVEPLKRSPVTGDRIIAKLAESDEVTFKCYMYEDGRQWLKPLNPQHPPIHEEFRVLGTVIGKWEPE
ncbi:LexA family protein [Algiphilus aromaticivorans]|uniref:LexA family protein n=1 Tax=Algiphilus aromaticivorans TaxID=382454 RepID=UPI000693F404|nr:S24 family peptidase [Algiphilus aromaticivorans]